MAKSIRSKAKRKNRTEFRNTIGTDAAKANMAIVQAKLAECINSGQMNSFDRISNLFAGNDTADSAMTTTTDATETGDDDAVMTVSTTKDASKIPAKKSRANKHAVSAGQYGDKTTRKV
eukprot:CAMPEP_0181115966 /NCGR_PEP_ID=MMETSP1071-20121207/21704_1 /TAXON_ID=35127 /ORGANISM="Thalassiosira sp., Strain NH16" /LENGTH=118 /DNA_ID=CAMNT_0023200189 /DNA_START=110 /DNA_END=463 /DNA_ORIENTATION=+